MHKNLKYILIATVAIIVGGIIGISRHTAPGSGPVISQSLAPTSGLSPTVSTSPVAYNFVGPRMDIPVGAPKDYGFGSLAVIDPGISRSGQPTLAEFSWLKSHGWKSIIDLRPDKEYGEIGDDGQLPGFNDLGFNYLRLPMKDGSVPTDAQAKQFLVFMKDKRNLPVLIHCRGGYGRTGTMVALYRYAIDKWPMDKAIAESKLFSGGIDATQQKWLENWAIHN